ncbi:MAG: hypothetical protein QJR01_08010 [Kyrpidia sp.]|nr:hypothetical protein [Kyrpidia sp.]
MRFSLGRPSGVGVSLHEHFVEVVRVDARGPFPILGHVLIPFPNDVYENGWIKDAPAFSERFRHRLAEAGLAGGRASLCLPSSTVVLRTVPVPRTNRKQARALLQFQIENELRLPFGNSVLDFDYFPPSFSAPGEPAGENNESLALVAAAPGDMVAQVDGAFRDMGIPLAAIEVKGLTILRALRAFGRNPGEGTLLIHFGPDAVDVHYYLKGSLLLSRWLDLNPRDYGREPVFPPDTAGHPADAEAAASGISEGTGSGSGDVGRQSGGDSGEGFANADHSGVSGAVAADVRTSGVSGPESENSAPTWMHLESGHPEGRDVFAADLQYQIDRLFSFLQYTLRRNDQAVGRVWLAGRVPYRREIAARLSDHLGLPADPLDQPRAPGGDVVDLAAFGAALRGVISDAD